MDHWLFADRFAEHASQSHGHGFTCTIENGIAVISSTVPDPAGFAALGQEVLAEDYHATVITLRGEFRVQAPDGRAGLILRANEGHTVAAPWSKPTSSPTPTTTSRALRPPPTGPPARSPPASETT